MTSAQDRNKLKRVSYDTWSTREQLCLASSVLKLGDQNWSGVSRSLKPFAEKEALRPPDWFTQKSCAMQYTNLLENADTPKRKKKESGESIGDSIVKRLTQERIAELGQILAFQRDEYQQLKAEVNMLRSGVITEEKLQRMWSAIEHEEREQEQKARVHTAWLAKRQQKQDAQSSQNLATHRKSLEANCEIQESVDSTNDDEEKKNRGGRSPLLTSLLKSPSPTTQMQNPGSTAQVNSPTIASLLGSSPKVPNPTITSSITPQFHQLVTNAMNNSAIERPSVGAPTLSMLLELPANLQRGSLASLQQAVANVQQQNAEIQSTSQSSKLNNLSNEAPSVASAVTPSASSISSESMVQIIDPIDDVIHKEIMTDAINKDEINEIIGDLEELIKEEITPSPEVIPVKVTPSPMEDSPIPEIEKIAPERLEPRDVDEPVSRSNSPQSEMAIEEIDQSTSSIAEIIGTAIEQPETRIIVEPVAEEPVKIEEKPEDKEEVKQVEKIVDETVEAEVSILEIEKEIVKDEKIAAIDKKAIEEVKKVEEKVEGTNEDILTPEVESKSPDPEKTIETEITSEKETEEAPADPKNTEVEETSENSVETKEKSDETKSDGELDQIEMNLAKITGDQIEANSTEVGSVCSEVTTDPPSMDDNDKSQDISMILEDDESSRSSSIKKKDTDDNSLIDNPVECSDSQESFKEDSSSREESKEPMNNERSSDVENSAMPEIIEKNDDDETTKVEESKDSDDEVTPETPEIEKKEDKVEETTIAESEETTSNEMVKSKAETTEEKDEKEEKDGEETEKNDNEGKVEKEEMEPEESTKIEIEDSEDEKCLSPVTKDEKNDVKDEPGMESTMERLDEPKKEEIIEDKDEDVKMEECELAVKKDIVESTGSVCDDMGDLDEEESSLSKLSGGRAMKTYSKKQTIAIDSEPENESSGENADYRAWKKAVMLAFNRLATHKYASLFLRPITEDQAPGYHSVIFRPMDLSTIKKNIDNGTIRSTMHFQRDVMLMFQNAIMYNKQDTFVYKMAVSMQEECLQHMQILVEVTGEGQLRRETRTAASSSSETSESSIKRKRSHITPSPHDTDSPRGKKRRKSEND